MMALFAMEERKHDLPFVIERIAAGDRARFFHSHFGQQVVELSRSWIWIFKRQTRVSLLPGRSHELKTPCTPAAAR
jgi:hypothetical protein